MFLFFCKTLSVINLGYTTVYLPTTKLITLQPAKYDYLLRTESVIKVLNHTLFFVRPLSLFDIRTQIIEPAFATLLAGSDGFEGFVELIGNLWPVQVQLVHLERFHECDEMIILLRIRNIGVIKIIERRILK